MFKSDDIVFYFLVTMACISIIILFINNDGINIKESSEYNSKQKNQKILHQSLHSPTEVELDFNLKR